LFFTFHLMKTNLENKIFSNPKQKIKTFKKKQKKIT